MYCMFLNTAGRVLFDSIISPGFEPNQFFLEVDQAMSKNVIKHLSMYRGMFSVLIQNIQRSFTPNRSIGVQKLLKQSLP